jgi:hypothetical protein
VHQSDLTKSEQTGIDVSTLTPGMYFYRLGNFKGSFVKN